MSNKREQSRQSWKRREQQSVVCQCVAVLLLYNLSIAQADKLPTGLRKANDRRNSFRRPAQATPVHCVDL